MKNFISKFYPILINAYTIWILYMMFFAYNRNSDEIKYEIYNYPFQSIYHLINGNDPISAQVINLCGNIILFMPYGFLGLLYPKLNQFKPLFITFFITINYLEICQYVFSRGFAEFDDMMLNCLGMSIGFLLYRKFFR